MMASTSPIWWSFLCQVRSDASLFLTELIEEAVKLGIEWPSSLEPGMIEEPTQ